MAEQRRRRRTVLGSIGLSVATLAAAIGVLGANQHTVEVRLLPPLYGGVLHGDSEHRCLYLAYQDYPVKPIEVVGDALSPSFDPIAITDRAGNVLARAGDEITAAPSDWRWSPTRPVRTTPDGAAPCGTGPAAKVGGLVQVNGQDVDTFTMPTR